MPGLLPHGDARTAYGVVVTRSDLALAALASAAVPGMQPISVVGVRAAADQPAPRHQVAFVEDSSGRHWVVRSPLDPAAGAELERNDALVRLLGRHVPFKVPAAAGYANLEGDGRAAVYPYVEGRALSLRHLPAGAGLASAVGRAVAAVHNIPRGVFEEADVPVFDAAGHRRRRLSDLDRAAETGHVPNGLLARWEQALEAAPMWQFATTPTHGSLDGSVFLVAFTDDDAASGRVVALTGWEQAQIADPADDFAALVDQASPAAFESVLDSYALARSQRPDPYLVQRARLASEMRLLAGLALAAASDDTDFLRRRADQLRKLDRLTSVDDSLVPRTVLVATDLGAGPSPTGVGEPVQHDAQDPPYASQQEREPVQARVQRDDSAAHDIVPGSTPDGHGEHDRRGSEHLDRADDPTEEVALVRGSEADFTPVTAPGGMADGEASAPPEGSDRSTDVVGTDEAGRSGDEDDPVAEEGTPPRPPGDDGHEPAAVADIPTSDVDDLSAAEPAGPTTEDSPSGPTTEDMEEAERLRTLYGMPELAKDGASDKFDSADTAHHGAGDVDTDADVDASDQGWDRRQP